MDPALKFIICSGNCELFIYDITVISHCRRSHQDTLIMAMMLSLLPPDRSMMIVPDAAPAVAVWAVVTATALFQMTATGAVSSTAVRSIIAARQNTAGTGTEEQGMSDPERKSGIGSGRGKGRAITARTEEHMTGAGGTPGTGAEMGGKWSRKCCHLWSPSMGSSHQM